MAENEPQGQSEKRPAKEPYGAGLLILFGLGLLVIAAFCAKDYFWAGDKWKGEEWKVWWNGAAMIVAALVAIYCFVLAFIRPRTKAGGGAKEAAPADE